MGLAEIGNKIFEKNEVELSEQVDLKNLSTLEKLYESWDGGKDIKEGIKINAQRQKTMDGYIKDIDKEKKTEEKASDTYFRMEEKFLKAKSDMNEAKERVVRTRNNIQSYSKEIEKTNKSLNPKVNKAEKLIASLEKNIAAFETAAKKLGFNVSGELKKYKSLQEQIKKVVSSYR